MISELEIRLRADIARLSQDMKQGQREVKTATQSMQADLMAVGNSIESLMSPIKTLTAAFGPLLAAMGALGIADKIRGVITSMADLDAMAKKTGVSVESLSGLKGFAKATNTDMDLVAAGLGKMNKALVEAKAGIGPAVKEFAALKIDPKNFSSAEDAMMGIAKQIANLKNGYEQGAAAQMFFGKSGANLLPMLLKMADAGQLNGKITSEQAAQARQFEMAMAKLGGRFNDVYVTLASSLLPILVKITDGFSTFLKVGAAYIAAFTIAPAIFSGTATALTAVGTAVAVTRTEMAAGATMAQIFGKSVGGIALPAEASAGALGVLKIAAGVLFAAFAGWEIGTWLRDQFVEARVAGLAFVGATLTGWENIKHAGEMAWEALKFTNGKMIGAIQVSMAEFFDFISKGFSLIGAGDTAGEIKKYADVLRGAGKDQKTFAEQTAGITAAHNKAVDAIDENIIGLVQYELAIKKTSKATATGKLDMNALSGATKDAADAAAAAAKKEMESYTALASALKEKSAANEFEIKTGKAMTESQKLAVKFDTDLASGKLVLTKAHEKQIRALQDEVNAQNAWLVAAKNTKAAVQALTDERQASYAAALKETEANEALVKTFGMSKDAIEKMEVARLQERLAQRESLELDEKEIEQLERMILVKQRNAAAGATLAGLEKQKKATEEATAQQKAFWESIDKTAHDTFVSILDGGKSLGARLKEALKNTFFDWLYQMTIKKWIINIAASTDSSGISGAVAAFGGGAGGGGATGLLGSASSLVSAGKMIYSGFSGGIASSLGGLVAGFGDAIGSAAISAFGAGMGLSAEGAAAAAAAYGGTATATGGAISAGAGAASAVPIVGWVIAGMMAAKSLFQQGWTMDGQKSDITQSLLASTAKGNFFGPVMATMAAGSGIADTILKKLGMSSVGANILSGQATMAKMFGHKSPEIESQGIRGSISATGFTGEAFADILEKGGWFRSDKRSTATATLGTDQESTLDNTVLAMITAVKGFGGALGVETSVIDGYNKDIKLILTADEAKNKEAIGKLFGDIANELSDRLLPGLAAFHKEGETSSATLQRLAMDYQLLDGVLTTIGTQFGAVGVGSLEARERLITLAGGMDKLATNVDGFAQNFLTEAQRLDPVAKMVAEALGKMGFASVDTRDEFRDAALSIDKTTEAGAKQFVQMMELQGAFAAVHPAIEKVTVAVRTAADIDKERLELQKRLDAATMTAIELQDQQRAALDATNQKLFDQAIAAEKVKTAAAALATTNAAMKADIDALVRASLPLAEQRKLDIASMDASTVALYDRRAALQAEAQATADAKAAADTLKATNEGYAKQIQDIDKLTMTARQVRKLEIAGMDATTVALYDTLAARKAEQKAIEDTKTALNTQAGIHSTFASDAQKLADAQKILDKGFAALHLAIPKTAADFLALSDGAKATTADGRALIAALELLAPSFGVIQAAAAAAAKQATDDAKTLADATKAAAETAAKDQADARAAIEQQAQAAMQALAQTNKGYQEQIDAILKSRMTEAQVRAFEIAGMAASTVALYDRLHALQAEQTATNAATEAARAAANQRAADLENARGALSKAYDTESQSLRQALEKASAFATSMRQFGNSLKLGAASPLSPEQRYAEAQRQFANATPENVQAAASALLDASKAYNAGSEQYARDYELVQRAISDAATAADAQASAADAQLSYLAQQVAGILTLNTTMLSVRDALANYQAAAMAVTTAAIQTAQTGTTTTGPATGTGPAAMDMGFTPYVPPLPLTYNPDNIMSIEQAKARGDYVEVVAMLGGIQDQLAAANMQRGEIAAQQAPVLYGQAAKLDKLNRQIAAQGAQ